VFVAGMLVHMMRVFFTGAFRKPRELNWLFGWTLLFLGIITGLTGYSLPDDLLSGTGIRFADGAILSVPIVGTYLSMFLFGGEFPGHDIISRLFPIHVLLLPGIMLGLVVAHLILVFYHKHTSTPGPATTRSPWSACRSCRSTWPRPAASSSSSSACSRSWAGSPASTPCGPSDPTGRTW
jgi:ubiquinol-cytochrome c reductase cytochrome b subunit